MQQLWILLPYLLAVMVPGANTALVIRYSQQGLRQGLAVVGGLAVANIIYAVLAVSGIAHLLAQLPQLQRIVTVLGGLYLLWIGWQLWPRHAVGSRSQTSATGNAFSAGLLSELLNPKSMVFLLSYLSIAITLPLSFSAAAGWVVAFTLIATVWYAFIALCSHRWLAQENWQQPLAKIAAAALMIFGLFALLAPWWLVK